ncbi:MAG: hypothetical protein ACO3E9_09650 [Gemmataceae bacterium]
MSLLGKIFALLNTMLAFGLGVVLVMDLGARRNWSYLVYRQDLVIHGLPLDKNQTTSADINISGNLTDAILKDLFKDAGNMPVPTQVDEVKRVYEEYEKKEKELGDTDKARLNARILLENSVTYAERLALQRYLGQGNMDELAKRFGVEPGKVAEQMKMEVTNLFLVAGILDKPKVPEGAIKISQTEMRTAIANLLLTMYQVLSDEKIESYGNETYLNRLVVVVGPDHAAKAMDGRSVVLHRAFDDLEAQMVRDKSNFVTEHRELISEMRARATEVHNIEAFIADYKNRVALQTTIVSREKDLLKKMENDLTDEREKTFKLVSELKKLSDGLFQVNKKLLGVREGNESLENKLSTVEKKQ